MYYYVLWDQVQRRLERWLKEHGSPIRFSQAVSLLVEEGQVTESETLPSVDFASWDCNDMDAFHRLAGAIPVNVAIFHPPVVTGTDSAGAAPLTSIHRSLDAFPLKAAAAQGEWLHYHENFEFLYVLSGEGGLYTQGGLIPCQEGSLCLVAPGFAHDVYSKPGSEVISLSLWRESVEDILGKVLREENVMTEFFHTSLRDKRPGYVILQVPPNLQIRRIVQNIFLEGYSRETYARELCEEYIELLFYYAMRACESSRDAYVRSGRISGVPMVAVMKYIQEHYRGTSLTEIARVFHYEPDYLGRQIKSYMGRGCRELILQLKTEEAKRLLKKTTWSAAQIAQDVGFSSPAHFSQTFRNRTGVSPLEYRNA